MDGTTRKKKWRKTLEWLLEFSVFTAALGGKNTKKNMQSRLHQSETVRRGFGKKELPFVMLTRKKISVQDFQWNLE